MTENTQYDADEPGYDRDAMAEARDRTHETGVRDVPREGFPWPPREGDSVISAFGRTWQGATLAPSKLFARMPAHGSLGAALLYYLAIGIAVAGAQLFWSMITGPASQPREVTAGAVDSALALSPLVNFLVAPLFLLGSLFLSAAVVHGVLKLLGGASQNYVFTARLFCFTYSPAILGVVPRIGAVAGFIWMVVIAIVGLRAGHRTTTARAIIAVLVPVSLALTFVAIVFLAARAAGILSLPV